MQRLNIYKCLMSLLATGSMAALAATVPSNVTSPLTNAVVWEIKPETLPDWGAPPDSPLCGPVDSPTTEFKLDNGARDKDVKIVILGKEQEWHGRMLQKTVAIYEDFTLEWQFRWEQKSLGDACQYDLYFGFGCVGLNDAWTGEAGRISGQLTGTNFKDSGDRAEPLQGQALFRIERTNGVLTICRDGRLLISKEARGTISAIQLRDKVYKNTARTRFVTEQLRLSLPSAGSATLTNAALKTALRQVRKSCETNSPGIYLDKANFEAKIDLLNYDLGRCRLEWQTDIRARCESNRLSIAGQEKTFFQKAEKDLNQIGYYAGMILQGSSGMEADAVIQAAGQWQAAYAQGKAELAKTLTAIQKEAEPFARKPEDWQKDRKFQMDHRAWITNHFVLKQLNHYGLAPPGYDEALRYMAEMGCGMLEEAGMFR
ncbi:MAG: hypothetical protein PHW60_12160, partial [Kiritimatiellae bacterium]|nr:hypothetical protein [Kiritimatiellia bacterium]